MESQTQKYLNAEISNFVTNFDLMGPNKLYEIIVLYGLPRDTIASIRCYLIAKDDKEVYDWINDNYYYGEWVDDDDDEMDYEEKENDIIENKGDLDSDTGYDDDIGCTIKHGWKEIGIISDSEANVLKKFKISR